MKSLVKTISRTTFYFFAYLIGIPTLLYALLWIYGLFEIRKSYLQSLPANLQVITLYSSIAWFDPMQCHFAVFLLTNETIAKIEKERLGFFNEHNINQSNYQWQETPVIDNEETRYHNSSFLTGVNCARTKNFDSDLLDNITKSALSKGAFYRSNSRDQLIVFPRMRIAVISGKEN